MLCVANDPVPTRIAILVALAVAYALYHAARWYLRRPKIEKNIPRAGVPHEASADVAAQAETAPDDAPLPGGGDAANEAEDLSQPGAEDYLRARAMMHQEIPDFRVDGLYLDLLAASAEKGYAPAMAKLGDYAMRRGTWVEAYYWMYRARRGGMADVDAALREIRRNWIQFDCPDEEENVNELFDADCGSIGRCLLAIAAGRDLNAAKDFLREFHPEFL